MSNPLTPTAQEKFAAYLEKMAEKYCGKVGQKFTATPSIEQILIDKIVEHGGWFMAFITLTMVEQLSGEKILLSLSGATGSRTDTSTTGKRVAKNYVNLANRGYSLVKFNNDFKILYDTMNAWAKFPDFAGRYQQMLMMSIADSIIMSGWHGTHAAADTDIATYPMMQDLSIGWLQLIRNFNSGSQHLGATTVACAFTDTGDLVTVANHGHANDDIVSFPTVVTTTGITANVKLYVISATQNTFQVSATKGGAAKALTTDGTGTVKSYITLGQEGFNNLDVIVTNAKNSIEPWLRNGLVAYISDNLVAREEAKYYMATVERADEKLLILQNGGQILQTYGGLRTYVPPYFPDNTIFIAPVGGLQFYSQTSSIRRQVVDWAEEDCVKDFNQRVAGHVIYNEEQCFLIEDIA